VADIVNVLKAKFPDAPDLEQDIVGMIELALEKAWLRQV
jgi:pyrroloquinoline quinone biosynthesis protein D